MKVKVQRALLSVHDKAGIADFARGLHELGIEIISSGGTAMLLEENGVPVTHVSDYTGFPEVFGGRLKTLHPKILGGILFRRGTDEGEAKKQGIKPVDLVVASLYPFEEVVSKNASLEEAVENIDIGGPTMIRAAAKNFESVAVVVDRNDYGELLRELRATGGATDLTTRRKLMLKAFERTSEYDSRIAEHFDGKKFPNALRLCLRKTQDLRYGENPHQAAAVYSSSKGLAAANQLAGKALSYNNYLDADAALSLLGEFKDQNACVIIKHTNPCGGAVGGTQEEAFEKALETDPVSAFGGIFAFTKKFTLRAAEIMGDRFAEIVMAPGFDEKALALLKQKKNRRILDVSELIGLVKEKNYRSIQGGLLVQEPDVQLFARWETASKRKPTAAEEKALLFGWKFAKHVKSNAIVLSNESQLVGVGAGQMSRVDSVELAVRKAEKAGLKVEGAVMASDAFFPFPDSIEAAAKAGITAVVQPGGSLKDKEVVEAADKLGLAMVVTGTRHFKH